MGPCLEPLRASESGAPPELGAGESRSAGSTGGFVARAYSGSGAAAPETLAGLSVEFVSILRRVGTNAGVAGMRPGAGFGRRSQGRARAPLPGVRGERGAGGLGERAGGGAAGAGRAGRGGGFGGLEEARRRGYTGGARRASVSGGPSATGGGHRGRGTSEGREMG